MLKKCFEGRREFPQIVHPRILFAGTPAPTSRRERLKYLRIRCRPPHTRQYRSFPELKRPAQYTRIPRLTPPPSDARPAKVTPSPILSSWVINIRHRHDMRAYPQRRSDDDAREQQRAWTEAAPLGHGSRWMDHSGPTIIRQVWPPHDAEAAGWSMCVCHARYYCGVGQLANDPLPNRRAQAPRQDRRHACSGRHPARQWFSTRPVEDGPWRAPHGPAHLRRPAAMALASCDVLFDCWANCSAPTERLMISMSEAGSRRLLRQKAHHKSRGVR